MVQSLFLLAEESGGLFDIDATLPLMAVQFAVLAVLLNALFYKPLGKAIDERDDYVRSNRVEASERLAKAKQLAEQYERELAETRRKSQTLIADAQAEAQVRAAEVIAAAQQQAQQQREEVQRVLDQQKQEAFATLEAQVDALSQGVLDKLLQSAS